MPSVLITGARHGLGFEFVRQYTAAGWRVFATGVELDGTADLQDMANASQGRMTLHALDVTDHRGIDDLANELAGQPVDVLINNAGVGDPDERSFGVTDYARWTEVMRVNLFGPMKMTEAFVEHVARSERKIVVAMASGLASMQRNVPGTPGPEKGGRYYYRTSKIGLNMLMRNLALDLADRNITAVALVPGHVSTSRVGPDAPLTPEQSVTGMRSVIDDLTQKDSGRYMLYTGEDYPL
jgi:NAD(P)-dependent dehydrogenase (short-subunit alcohol dehydrogenase family)